jgi:hypothetical protein
MKGKNSDVFKVEFCPATMQKFLSGIAEETLIILDTISEICLLILKKQIFN